MKKELIEKAALKDSVDGLSRDYGRFDCSAVFDTIDDAPLIDAVEVRHGFWVFDSGDEYSDRYHCSECGKEIDICNEIVAEPKPNYCPNCGAKMDGRRESEAG